MKYYVDRLQSTQEFINSLPVNTLSKHILVSSPITPAGQFVFIGMEMDLLELYLGEDGKREFADDFLFPSPDGYGFVSKSSHYFKEYPDNYRWEDYLKFVQALISWFKRINSTQFEESDKAFQLKLMLTIADELINHASWLVYLSYQAGGVRRSNTLSLQPWEKIFAIDLLLKTSKVYTDLFVQGVLPSAKEIESMVCEVENKHGFTFIAKLAKEGTRDQNGSFFRIRDGCREIANVIHALCLKNEILERKKHIDVLIAAFHAGLTSASCAYCVLKDIFPSLDFEIFIHSSHEDHFSRSEIVEISLEKARSRLLEVPALVRPRTDYSGKNLLIVDDTVCSGNALKGIRDFLRHFNPKEIYSTAVEIIKAHCEEIAPFNLMGDLEVTFNSTFFYLGMGPHRKYRNYLQENLKRQKE